MRLVSGITQDYGRLDGILHCAGAIADEFIIRKSEDDFRRILAPKVLGTFHLDEASGDTALDWLVLFSSVASAMGNAGQSDYAAANGFLDQFAVHRNRLVEAGRRHGRTVSILWPFWEAGGMALDDASRELLQRATGMSPLRTTTGMEAFRQALSAAADRILVAEGDVVQIRRALVAGFAPPSESRPAERSASVATAAAESLSEQTRDYLGRQLATVLKVPAASIDPQAALERYGIDSILALKLTAELEKTFGALSRTLFFEYRTIDELSRYFLEAHAARLTELFKTNSGGDARPAPVEKKIPGDQKPGRRVRFARTAPARPATESEPIAIIGLSGRYPEAFDIGAYWNNLRDGKDCITEVPPERWNWRDYFSEDRTRSGHHYSRWGGFIAGVDEFDPLFFNIAPKEAKLIDPQERLFLQHAWMALEDAGYTRAGLQLPAANDLPGQVGVYVGVMYTEYQLFGPESAARGNRLGVAGSAASIANRVSYVLNLHGPSVTLDTMCSSSLTAIHYACQDLKNGRTALAIAGGVNVTIHPNKYLVLSQGQFISSDGHCQSFGEGGDGYIPGEGVGVVVLKRLSEARKDGDHVYGVIRGSALNHGGRTNGYSVPNPQAQAGVISRVLAESGVDARAVSYIEAHGTGTKLGDPIEIAALSKAFERFTKDKGFCRIGSAKSNIGHCESAAGIAGLTKVLLQMQYRQIVPSLHSERLNPHIDFERTPFVVNQSLCPWEQPVIEGRRIPRIAGISSFGAGGSNAHVIVEEAEPVVMAPQETGPVAVLLSARTDDQLRHKARELLEFVRARMSALDPASVAYTLQVGREPMDERVGFIVDSLELLTEKLQAFLDGEGAIEGVHQGQVKRGSGNLSIFATDRDLQETIDKWIAGRKLSRLVELWVKGVEPDWSRLYGDVRPARVSLPTYPFARERYWIDIVPAGTGDRERSSIAALHPLLHRNTSNLSEQRYTSSFTGEEPFVLERGGRKVLMEAVCLEMARAAVEQSLPGSADDATLELRDMDWLEPALVVANRPIHVSLCENDGGEVEIEIYSGDTEEDVIHWRGVAAVVDRDTPIAHALGLAAERRISLRKPILDDAVLDPAVLQSALEGAAGGALDSSSLAIDSLRIVTACQGEMFGSMQRSGSGMDVDLCDARGNVCVEIRGLHVAQTLARPAAAVMAASTPAAQSERKKPSISLTAPGQPWVATASSAPRPAVTLPKTSARPQGSSGLSDERGDGIVALRIDSSATPQDVRETLERIQNNRSARVVTISGLEALHAERELLQTMAAFPLPLVALLRHDTVGAAFLYAALCDFMVCSEEARYGYADATPAEESLLSERFGEARVLELLHGPEILTGDELRKRGWTCPIVPASEVDGRAQEIASALASRSREALWLLAPHLKRRLIPFAGAVTFSASVLAIADGTPPAPRAIGASGGSMDLEARQDVLVARLHENAQTEDLLADLGRLFAEIGQDAFYQAIVLAGAGELFPALNSENLLQFQRLLDELRIPVIAALEGDAKGNGWLAALLCDGCLYSREGVYSAAGIDEAGAAVFAQRLGNAFGREVVLAGGDCTGAELQRRAGIWMEERERVLPMAVRLAAKRGMTRGSSRPSLTIAATAKERDEALNAIPAPAPIALRSEVVRAMAYPDGIVVVTMEDREAKNMFSEALAHGLSEAFEQIGRSPLYKAVVLTGYDQYFSSGGTRESLLAIQAGEA
ncbi:MAG TPA: beta-ketoacyl synthase N-terminal-like domain-containing protein, partial [Thermoanaerobaculia bacterium]|nr:beta-ketoacyl synthase N-terminal-like domain-containing protein [Thermoanaerobaculia bacterium]